MKEALYALGAAAALLAVAVGWLLRDRSARRPATERANAAADALRTKQDDAATVRAAEQERALAAGLDAARKRQEIGTHAAEPVDQTINRLGNDPAPLGRLRQERGTPPKPRP